MHSHVYKRTFSLTNLKTFERELARPVLVLESEELVIVPHLDQQGILKRLIQQDPEGNYPSIPQYLQFAV